MQIRLASWFGILLLAGCDDPMPSEPGIRILAAKAPFVTVTPSLATLTFAGDQVQLAADVKNGKPVAWSSGNSPIAVVSSGGLVTAISEGTAVITAQVGPHAASATITVDFP